MDAVEMELGTVLPAGSEITPLVSVIVPVYNAEKTLEVCLDSIRNQTETNLEVLLVNDGSQDGSAEICRRYAEADNRFRFFTQENRGVSAARNRALEQARGEYLLFVDSDDRISPTMAADLSKAMEQGELAVCNYYECDLQSGENRPKDYCQGRLTVKQFAFAMAKKPIHNYYNMLCNRMFRRDILERNHLRFDEAASYGEDFALLLEYLMDAQHVMTIPQFEYYYNYHENNSLSKGKRSAEKRIEQTAYVYRNYRNFWCRKGWYGKNRKLVQFYGARLFFEERNRMEKQYWPELYRRVLAENNFNRADYLFFLALRRGKKLLRK